MAVTTRYPTMQSCQPIPGPIVIETLRPLPGRLGVTLLTALLSKLFAVRILRAVAFHAGGTESEKRPVECIMVTLELQDVGRRYQPALVTVVAGNRTVRCHQLEANRFVVEGGSIESH